MEIDTDKYVVVDRQLFKELVRNEAHKMSVDNTKGLMSLSEACNMLGVHYNKFYRLLKDPESLLKASKLRGKYVRRSVERELLRLTGKL